MRIRNTLLTLSAMALAVAFLPSQTVQAAAFSPELRAQTANLTHQVAKKAKAKKTKAKKPSGSMSGR
jgi:hypothetical protein